MKAFIEITISEKSCTLINVDHIISIDVYDEETQVAVITSMAQNGESVLRYYPYETYEEIKNLLQQTEYSIIVRKQPASAPKVKDSGPLGIYFS